MNLVKNLLGLLFSPIHIPVIPDELNESINSFFGYLDNAAGLIGLFFPIDMTPFFVIFFGIFALSHAYPLVMWILRKIPMLGIE